MGATFCETRPFTSRDHLEKNVWAFQDNHKKLLSSYYSDCFLSLFASKMLISDGLKFFQKTYGYFQWSFWTHCQKMSCGKG